jgi:hypothetical protein
LLHAATLFASLLGRDEWGYGDDYWLDKTKNGYRYPEMVNYFSTDLSEALIILHTPLLFFPCPSLVRAHGLGLERSEMEKHGGVLGVWICVS